MVVRMMLLLMLYEAKSMMWILEQPVNSVMQFHPRFQEFLAWCPFVVRKSCQQGFFGGASSKPTWLYCNSLAIDTIDLFRASPEVPFRELAHTTEARRHMFKYVYMFPCMNIDTYIYVYIYKNIYTCMHA